MENQAVIIAHQTNEPPSEILKQMDEYFEKNYRMIDDQIQKDIPDYPKLP